MKASAFRADGKMPAHLLSDVDKTSTAGPYYLQLYTVRRTTRSSYPQLHTVIRTFGVTYGLTLVVVPTSRDEHIVAHDEDAACRFVNNIGDPLCHEGRSADGAVPNIRARYPFQTWLPTRFYTPANFDSKKRGNCCLHVPQSPDSGIVVVSVKHWAKSSSSHGSGLKRPLLCWNSLPLLTYLCSPSLTHSLESYPRVFRSL